MISAVDQVILRPMQLDDIPTVVSIDRLSFSLPWSERTYRYELVDNASATLLVAELPDETGARVVGYLGYWMIVDEAHISTLAVHPDHRRNGIGERLLRLALRQAAARGAKSASLEVRVSNDAAIRLYRKYGFQVAGRRVRYYRDNDEDAYIMTVHRIQGLGEEEVPGERR